MTWAQTLGGPHGGVLPTPQVNDLPNQLLYAGDPLVITGTGFTPGTQVIAEPGGKLLGTSNPTDTTTINLTVPYNLPNVKHTLCVTNGNTSNKIDLFVVRDVTIQAAPNTLASVTVVEAN